MHCGIIIFLIPFPFGSKEVISRIYLGTLKILDLGTLKIVEKIIFITKLLMYAIIYYL